MIVLFDEKKKTRKQLEILIDECNSDELNLSELLSKNNYSLSLKGFVFPAKFFERFNAIIFSGINLLNFRYK